MPGFTRITSVFVWTRITEGWWCR